MKYLPTCIYGLEYGVGIFEVRAQHSIQRHLQDVDFVEKSSFDFESLTGVDPALFGLFSIFISSFVLIFIWKGFGILFATLNL